MDVTAAVLAVEYGDAAALGGGQPPKVVAPVGGRPEICYILDHCVTPAFSTSCCWLATGPTSCATLGNATPACDCVLGRGTNRWVRLRYGMPCRCWKARRTLLNGDSYCDVDLLELYREHLDHAPGVARSRSCRWPTRRPLVACASSDDGQVMRIRGET